MNIATANAISPDAVAARIPGLKLKIVDRRICLVDARDRPSAVLDIPEAQVWKLCTPSRSVAALCDAAAAARSDGTKDVGAEVTTTLRHLYRKGVISFKCRDSAVIPRTYHVNMSDLLSHMLDERGWRAAGYGELAEFAFYYRTAAYPQLAKYQTFDLFLTRSFAHKAMLAERIIENGHGSVIPETYTSVAAFERHAERNKDTLWFLKHAYSGRQRHVFCCRGFDDLIREATLFAQKYIGQSYVIQRGIRPYLIDGCKATLRVHALLLADRSVYVYQNPFMKIQDVPYDPNDTDGRIHYLHLGLPRRPFSEYPELRGVMQTIGDNVATIMRLFMDDCCVTGDAGCYAFLGLDVVLDRDRRPYVVEVNDSPAMRLSDTSTSHHRNKVNIVNNWLEVVRDGRRDPRVGGFERVI